MAGPSRYYAPYVVTMASAATLTSELDLSGAWNTVYLEVPTMTSNTQLHIQGSYANSASGGSYRRIYHPPLNSSTVATNPFAIVSGATNCIVPIPGGVRFLKIESTATVNDGAIFRVFVGD